MTNRVKETVKRGTWIYDGTAPCEVWIIKQNFIEGPRIDAEELHPGYPPYDEHGEFYYAAYAVKRALAQYLVSVVQKKRLSFWRQIPSRSRFNGVKRRKSGRRNRRRALRRAMVRHEYNWLL